MSRYYLRATILTASLLGLAVVLPVNATAAAAAAPASIAAPAGRPTINLSLNEAVAIALQKNFDVKTQDLTLANNKETYNSAKLEYKPTMSVGTSFNGSQSGATGSSIAASDHVDSQAVTGSVSQKIPTGAVVSLTSTFLSRSNTANSPTTPSFGRLLTLSVSQPLLRGAGTKYNLTSLRNSKISLDQSFLSYKTALINTVGSIETAYTNLILARQNLEISRQSLDLAKQTYDEQVSRSNAGLVTPINLLQSENNYLSSQNTLLTRQLALTNAEDNLRLLLGGKDYAIGIVPTDDLASEKMDIPTVEGSYRITLENGVEYKNAKFSVETAENSVYTAKSNRKPTVNLTGSVTTSDTGVANWGSSYHKVSENSNYGWSLGLTVNVPLGERTDLINYRRALNSLESAKISLTKFEETTLVSVRSAVNTVTTSIKSVELSVKQAELSRQTYEADKQRFDFGAITIRTLNQSQSDLDTARFNLVAARLTLRNAIISLRKIENTTLDRYSIKLPE
jgi:outer membrane protein TolC